MEFDTFLADLPVTQRERLLEIFEWIHLNYAELEPVMKWNQPMYQHHGTFIIGFSVAKKHMAIAPEKETLLQFKDKIQAAGYSQTAMLFRIKWDEPVHYELLQELIDYNIQDKKDCQTFWRK
ncbi:iron chaperone [Macrococcus hajekii]|uniref:Iron chaperone n=1 Tax=Macrococcus hajekii TaxID=198482 RepID=A0A4V3BDY5_9STAP|nr:DUF1801 domain-containing protein [Macrococcus hajekii]TDM01934.1 iron chaperone [Macrococcus hajekii]GGB08667.1 intracellular iron chaperone frataxin [Macrococcus hajekii]